jgi:PTH2 family peptidyl-tRNA hydrolase
MNYKQVIILRSDLDMSKGKMTAQACHAAVSSAEKARITYPIWWKEWMNEGQSKIVLKVESKLKLLKLEKETIENKLPSTLVRDKGLTEIPPGTITSLGIGPAPVRLVNKITGELPLL